jgi:hypothetical protein
LEKERFLRAITALFWRFSFLDSSSKWALIDATPPGHARIAACLLLVSLAPCRADPAPVIHYAPAENLENVDVALIDGVNRRRTLTPPQLSHNQLKQHRNLQFSENLTGVQF